VLVTPHDPDALRWLAFTDAELSEIEGALGAVAAEYEPVPDHPDPLDDLLDQVRAERWRRSGTHAANRAGPRTSPSPDTPPADPPRLVVGEPVVVNFDNVPGAHPFGARREACLVLERPTPDRTVAVRTRAAGLAWRVPLAAVVRERRGR
jgi:hypothetical protein